MHEDDEERLIIGLKIQQSVGPRLMLRHPVVACGHVYLRKLFRMFTYEQVDVRLGSLVCLYLAAKVMESYTPMSKIFLELKGDQQLEPVLGDEDQFLQLEYLVVLAVDFRLHVDLAYPLLRPRVAATVGEGCFPACWHLVNDLYASAAGSDFTALELVVCAIFFESVIIQEAAVAWGDEGVDLNRVFQCANVLLASYRFWDKAKMTVK